MYKIGIRGSSTLLSALRNSTLIQFLCYKLIDDWRHNLYSLQQKVHEVGSHLCLIHKKPINNKCLKRIINPNDSGSIIPEQKNRTLKRDHNFIVPLFLYLFITFAGEVMTSFNHVVTPTRGNWFQTNSLEHEHDGPYSWKRTKYSPSPFQE